MDESSEKGRRGARIRKILIFFLILTGISVSRETDENHRCMVCHGRKGMKVKVAPKKYLSLYIDYKKFRESVHGEKLCTDCHTDVVVIPHLKRPKKIDCLQCHYEGNVFGAPVEKFPEKYKESVHGKARKEGKPNSPVCIDCHTTHYVRSPEDTLSSVYKTNVIRVCGKCHLHELSTYNDGVHGKALSRGDKDAPSCNDCHREHDILPPNDPRSSLHPKNVVMTCARCHADVKVMKRKGVPVEQVKAFKESFHWIALKFGVLSAANCVSCHGSHLILSSTDPRSPIHPRNLAKTCGKCHPRADENVAKGKFHILPEEPKSGIVFYVSLFFKWFTFLILAALVFHIILDLIGRVRMRKA